MLASKVDQCQAEIVEALRQMGALVMITSDVGKGFPDLVVGYKGQVYLLECKIPGGVLTQVQKEWHSRWQGYVYIVHNPGEAYAAIT